MTNDQSPDLDRVRASEQRLAGVLARAAHAFLVAQTKVQPEHGAAVNHLLSATFEARVEVEMTRTGMFKITAVGILPGGEEVVDDGMGTAGGRPIDRSVHEYRSAADASRNHPVTELCPTGGPVSAIGSAAPSSSRG